MIYQKVSNVKDIQADIIWKNKIKLFNFILKNELFVADAVKILYIPLIC